MMSLFEILGNRRNKNSRKLITRVTCDLDTQQIDDLIRCLKTFKKYHFSKDLQVNTSPSGRGFHVISWSDKGVTLEKLLKIRHKAGDDRTRISLDSWGSGQRMINVLFTGKKKRKLKKGDVVFDNQDMQVETCGAEDNIKISFGET